MYSDAAKTISRLIHCEVASILRYRDGFPTTLAAFRKSLQSSSSLVIVRTMLPSCVRVMPVITWKGTPRAHSYTQAARPKLRLPPSSPLLPAAPKLMPPSSCSFRKAPARDCACARAVSKREVSWASSSFFSYISIASHVPAIARPGKELEEKIRHSLGKF